MENITEKNVKLFSDKNFNRELLKYAVPIALQQLMLSLVSVADTVMLGSVHQDCMSAVSLAAQVQFIQNAVISCVAAGMGILGSQYLGKKDMRSVDDIYGLGLRINGIISLITFLATVFIPEKLMTIYTNEPALIDIGVRYLKIAGWSYLVTGVSQCYLAMIKITDKVKHTAIISIVTVLLNIVLNAILIFGLFGAPRMEEQGAALATLISRIVELVWCIILTLLPGFIRPTLRGLVRHNGLLTGDFLRCTIPILIAYLLWSVGVSSYSAFMGHLGKDVVAASSLSSVIREMVCVFCMGLARGGGIIIGKHLGSGDLAEGKKAGIRTFKWSFLCGVGTMVLMLIVIPIVVPLANMTDVAKDYLLKMMLITSIYVIGRAINTIIINGVFEAGGDTRFDPISLAICMWCVSIPLAYFGTFVFHWEPLVIFAIICIDEVGKIPLTIMHYKKYKWVKNLTR